MRFRIAASLLLLAATLPAAATACGKKEPTPAAGATSARQPAPAPGADTARTIDVNAVVAAAGLDEAAKARVAPHIAAMNEERATLHALTGQVGPATPDTAKARIHKELQAHFASFDKHWGEATAGMTAQQKQAFDAAVREQMGARPRNVGNPHSKLPGTHPKLDSTGSAAKK